MAKKISFFLFLICTFFSCMGGGASALSTGETVTASNIEAEYINHEQTETKGKEIKVSSRLYELLFKKQGEKEKTVLKFYVRALLIKNYRRDRR